MKASCFEASIIISATSQCIVKVVLYGIVGVRLLNIVDMVTLNLLTGLFQDRTRAVTATSLKLHLTASLLAQ